MRITREDKKKYFDIAQQFTLRLLTEECFDLREVRYVCKFIILLAKATYRSCGASASSNH